MVRQWSLCMIASTNFFAALMGLKWKNSGQACITANRVYVQSGAYERFAKMIKERTSRLVLGHGSDPLSTLGPVTTPQSLERAIGQVEDARRHGGKILLGGKRLGSSTGLFFEPTIIGDAKKEMRVTTEETFAPILTLYRFTSESEAVQLANDTPVSGGRKRGSRRANKEISDGLSLVRFYERFRPSLETR